jgi:hypothetical protein
MGEYRYEYDVGKLADSFGPSQRCGGRRLDHLGSLVSRFRYGRDPACLLAIAIYAANSWWVKPLFPGGFVHDQLNDVLLIPALLPLVLWVDRRLGWRSHDRAPTPGEIAFHFVTWSLICEAIGPRLFGHGTGDLRDVVAYAAGGALAALWWARHRNPGQPRAADPWPDLRQSRKT